MKQRLLAAGMCLTAFSTLAPCTGHPEAEVMIATTNCSATTRHQAEQAGRLLTLSRPAAASTWLSMEGVVNATFDPFMPAGNGNSGGTRCPRFWIGLCSPSANGSHAWVTGETLSYTN